MKRQEALKKAHDYLKGRSGEKIKEKARTNQNLSYMSVAHAVADIYQRGENPKDMDLQKIDWGVSYGNIRGQIEELLQKRGGRDSKFEDQKDRERESGVDRQRKHEQSINKEIAEQRHKRRPDYNQFIDETKNAQKTFSHATEKAVRKWSRNPNKYDLKGVDTRKEKEARKQAQLPFRRKSRIQKMKSELKGRYGNLEGFERPEPPEAMERQSRIEALKDKKVMEFEQDRNKNTLVNKGRASIKTERNLDLKGSNLAENKDSRSMAEIGKNIRGNTSERSTQKGLRELGMASKKSEKTLDNFSKSVSDSGKQVSNKFDGNYF